MFIEELKLNNFRNYKDFNINFDKKVNLILGNNAQGKTNLLEAIYITSIGKSFRTNKENEMIRFGCDYSQISVKAQKDYLDTNVDIIINKQSKKSIKKDGIQIKKISQLLENILIVIFSPEDLKIVKDEPEKRRKFIDRELCQISPLYYENLYNYKKVLYQRNFYLKEKEINKSVLDVWDAQLAKYGAQIIRKRNYFIKKLSMISCDIEKSITNNKEYLFLEYDPNVKLYEEKNNSNEQEKYFYDIIKESFENDIRLRTTTRGPHKDDIIFNVNGINIRNYGSQGQQRTAALSLKLAELSLIKEETSEDPILLLDDVMSELDIERQEYLIKTLKDNQVFITTTDVDEKLKNSFPNAKIFFIENGNIKTY